MAKLFKVSIFSIDFIASIGLPLFYTNDTAPILTVVAKVAFIAVP
jgi:hypothetical protein